MYRIIQSLKHSRIIRAITVFVLALLLIAEVYYYRNQLADFVAWPTLTFTIIILLLLVVWYRLPMFRKMLGEDKSTIKRSKWQWITLICLAIVFIFPVSVYNLQNLSIKPSQPYFVAISLIFTIISFGLMAIPRISLNSRKELICIGQKFAIVTIAYIVFIPLLNLLNQPPLKTIDIYAAPNFGDAVAWFRGIIFYLAALLFYGGEFLFSFGITDLLRTLIDLDISLKTDDVNLDERLKFENAIEKAVSSKGYDEGESIIGKSAVQGYNFTMDITWSDKDKWTLAEMKFEDVYKGWDIIFSETGAHAIHQPFQQEPTKMERERWEAELKQVVIKLRDTLVFLMNIHTRSFESGPSVKTMLTGPSQVNIKTPINSELSWTTASTSPPSVEVIHDFWSDLTKNPTYKRTVDYYVNALKASSETEIAVELYKILEVLESHFGSEKNTCGVIGYSLIEWKNLKQNLNSGKRHIADKYKEPNKKISTVECLTEVKEIIEKFRGK